MKLLVSCSTNPNTVPFLLELLFVTFTKLSAFWALILSIYVVQCVTRPKSSHANFSLYFFKSLDQQFKIKEAKSRGLALVAQPITLNFPFIECINLKALLLVLRELGGKTETDSKGCMIF